MDKKSKQTSDAQNSDVTQTNISYRAHKPDSARPATQVPESGVSNKRS